MGRDATIDIVRSMAILLMVAANMAIIAAGDPAWAFRLFASFAAPIFIILANMMVVLGIRRGKDVSSSIIKCLFLFIVAGLFDLSNSLLPFINVDVLYMLGISLIITSIFAKYSNKVMIGAIVIILAITPYLQWKFGYQQQMIFDITDENVKFYFLNYFNEALHRHFIDGWFPLFPWVSLALFGGVIGKLRYAAASHTSFCSKQYVLISLALITIGAILWYFYPGEQAVRYDYIELFYQPVPGFMIFMMGVTLGVICCIDYIGDISLAKVIHPLGEAPLFMYLFHIAFIDHVLLPLGTITFGVRYIIYYLLLISLMLILSRVLEKIRKQSFYKKSPHVVKWVFG